MYVYSLFPIFFANLLLNSDGFGDFGPSKRLHFICAGFVSLVKPWGTLFFVYHSRSLLSSDKDSGPKHTDAFEYFRVWEFG